MKFTRFLILAAMLMLLTPFAATANTLTFGEVRISGFVETLSTLNFDAEDDASAIDFAVQSARVRFDTRLAPWISANAEIASSGSTNPANLNPTLRRAIVALFTTKDDITYRLEFGRKAIPFGVASGWYTAPANAFIYQPSVTTSILGSWSDEGIFGSVSGKNWSVQAYAVEGNETRVISTLDPEDLGAGIAGGLRATVRPVAGLNLGVSYALNGQAQEGNYSIMAGDVVLKLGPCTLTYQYLASMPEFDFDVRRDSWFAQVEFDLTDIIGVPIEPGFRFDYFAGSVTEDNKAATIITVQAMYKFEKVLRIGLSYRNGKSHTGDQFNELALQVMTMF
jgi:hypothetical protein